VNDSSADHTAVELPPPKETADFTAILAGLAEGPSGSRFNDLMRAASRHARDLVRCEVARIWVLRRGGRRLVARDYPEGDSPPVEHRLASHEGLAGWVTARGEPLRLSAGGLPPGFLGEPPEFRSALVVPLKRRGETFAAVECLDRRDGKAFSMSDLAKLQEEADPLAIALDNTLLTAEIERKGLEKEVLFEVTKVLSATLDMDEVLAAIFRSLRQVVPFDAAAIYLVNPSTLALERVADVGYPQGSDEAFGLRVGVGLVGWVAKTGEPVIVPDVAHDARYVAARHTTRSELAVPLVVEQRTIGVFNLENDIEDFFHENHLELVTAFASHAAVAIERARFTRQLVEQRRLEKELAIAREIQLSFLPRAAPIVPGFELAGVARTHAQVGGDYYGFIPVSDYRIGIAIADASGKGIPAALLMAGFRMSLLAEIRNDFAIRAVMRKVNTLLHESIERDKFVTAFYGVLDHKNRVLIFSNAGHNPPILARADGSIELLLEGGVALGVLPDAIYEERPIALQPGDVLLLYTDGVTEAEAPGESSTGSGGSSSSVSPARAVRDRHPRSGRRGRAALGRRARPERRPHAHGGQGDALALTAARSSFNCRSAIRSARDLRTKIASRRFPKGPPSGGFSPRPAPPEHARARVPGSMPQRSAHARRPAAWRAGRTRRPMHRGRCGAPTPARARRCAPDRRATERECGAGRSSVHGFPASRSSRRPLRHLPSRTMGGLRGTREARALSRACHSGHRRTAPAGARPRSGGTGTFRPRSMAARDRGWDAR
jgi:GAF domain-containing protein